MMFADNLLSKKRAIFPRGDYFPFSSSKALYSFRKKERDVCIFNNFVKLGDGISPFRHCEVLKIIFFRDFLLPDNRIMRILANGGDLNLLGPSPSSAFSAGTRFPTDPCRVSGFPGW